MVLLWGHACFFVGHQHGIWSTIRTFYPPQTAVKHTSKRLHVAQAEFVPTADIIRAPNIRLFKSMKFVGSLMIYQSYPLNIWEMSWTATKAFNSWRIISLVATSRTISERWVYPGLSFGINQQKTTGIMQVLWWRKCRSYNQSMIE